MLSAGVLKVVLSGEPYSMPLDNCHVCLSASHAFQFPLYERAKEMAFKT